MNDVLALTATITERLLKDRPATEGVWEPAIWTQFQELGLIHAAVPEPLGGSGLAKSDAAAIVHLAAYHNAALPLAETIAAGWLLASAGVAVPDGPLTIATQASLEITVENGAATLDGVLPNLPWLDIAGEVIAVGHQDGVPMLLRLRGPFDRVSERQNMAGEPRTSIRFVGAMADKANVIPLPAQASVQDPLLFLAALRALQMTGAMHRALDTVVDYVNVRTQFGRQLSKFQAIQQGIAMATGHYASALSIARSAIATLDVAPDPDLRLLAIGSAKSVGGEAATLVAANVHQVMGAIGFTREHDLHRSTRRLWSWREEAGDEAFWNERVGRMAKRRGPSEFWELLTSVGLSPGGEE